MHDGPAIDLRSYRLDPALEPYFSALIAITVTAPAGHYVEDCLHPEWAAIRFTDGDALAKGGIHPDQIRECSRFAVSGPTSRALRFALPETRLVSLGIRAAGWARFVPVAAGDLADRIVDASDHPAFAAFAPLVEVLRHADGNDDIAERLMNEHLLDLHERFPPVPDRVLTCQQVLWDPEVAGIEEFCERVGVSRRTLERLCSRYFGFTPKKLLRRQRFLRSLGQYMHDPAASWSGSLDGQYCDQAHFVREFRSFMGMTPSEYAAMPHPFLGRIMARTIIGTARPPQSERPQVRPDAVRRSASDNAGIA